MLWHRIGLKFILLYLTLRYLNVSGIYKCDANQFSNKRSIYCDNGWIGDESIIHSSASIDFEMVCSDQWKKSFAQSLYMVSISLKFIRLIPPQCNLESVELWKLRMA